MPLPIAHGCVGAGIVALSRPKSSLGMDWHMLLFGAVLAIIPDLDFMLIWVFHLSNGWHRSFTHSILMGFIVTALLIGLLGTARIREAVAYGAAYLSHGILDFLTAKHGGGVELFWPFVHERFKLGLISFSELMHGITLSEMFKASLIELTIFAPMLLALLLVREFVLSGLRSSQGEA